MPVLVGGEVGAFDAEEIFHRAGDVVAFGDLRRAGDGAFEGLLAGLGMGVEAHGHIGGEADAELDGVEDGAVALDQARTFHVLHAAEAGGGREADAFGEDEVGDPAIAAKFLQYPGVYTVNLRHLLRIMCVLRCICNPAAWVSWQELRHDI